MIVWVFEAIPTVNTGHSCLDGTRGTRYSNASFVVILQWDTHAILSPWINHQHTFDELMLTLHMQTRVGINNRNSQVPKISWYTWLKSSRKELRYDTIRFISDNITMSTIMKKRTATPKKRENKSENKSEEQFDQDCQPHVCSGTFYINMYGVHHLP
jgi:hypothetical protein